MAQKLRASSRPRIDSRALFHQAQSSWSALIAPQTLQITLRAKAGEFASVLLQPVARYGGDYAKYPPKPMQPVLQDRLYDYWQCTLFDIPIKRYGYYFNLEKKGHSFLFGELGVMPAKTKDVPLSQCFQFPYLHDSDIFEVPEWARGALNYQVFPDRFFKSPHYQPLHQRELAKWGSKPTPHNMMGGNLQGIREKVPYLAELGIDVLYMTPIFKAHSNHKYDTIDYKQIDPDFGSNQDLGDLVETCHQEGIKVVLDAVFNHSGPDFPPFADVQKRGKNSRYADWFHISSFPFPHYTELLDQMEAEAKITGREPWAVPVQEDGSSSLPYDTFAHTPMMPKLNTQNPEMKEYLLEAGEYWIREWGIDGWRLDVANEVDHQFWREFRQRVKAAKSDALIIGEIWHDSSPWLRGDEFDGVMNYSFQSISFEFFLSRKINKQRAQELFNQLLLRYVPQVNQVLWNILDTHDTPRLLHQCQGRSEQSLQLLGFMLCYIGAPLLYYGSEVGLAGAGDPDCRRCMPWDESEWQPLIEQGVRRLIALRKQYPVLRTGSLRWFASGAIDSPHILAFERFDPSEREASRLLIFNRYKEAIAFDASLLPANYEQKDLISENKLPSDIPAYGMWML